MSQERRLNTNEQQAQPLDLEEIIVTIEGEATTPPEEPLERPDPAFKRVVEKGAEEWKVGSGPTELKTKQLTSPDLFLEVPLGTNLDGSPFEFFRRYNIIEFKSRNDKLTYAKFKSQLGRVLIWGGEHGGVADADLLNVIVSARRPETLFKRLAKHKRNFTKLYDKIEGIYIERSEYNDVVLVVCRELPVEPKYAMWLLFANPNSAKWRAAVRMMADNGLVELLEEAEKLNPKEFRAMSSDIEERLALLNPQEQKEYMQAIQELTEDRLAKMSSEQRRAVLAKLPMEEIARMLPMEERLKDVPVEERLKDVPVEERLKDVPVEEIARALPPEQLGDALSKLPPEEIAKLLQKLQPPKQGEAE